MKPKDTQPMSGWLYMEPSHHFGGSPPKKPNTLTSRRPTTHSIQAGGRKIAKELGPGLQVLAFIEGAFAELPLGVLQHG